MPVINRSPINAENDDDHYEALVERQTKADKNYDTLEGPYSIFVGSTVAARWEEEFTMDPQRTKVTITVMTNHTKHEWWRPDGWSWETMNMWRQHQLQLTITSGISFPRRERWTWKWLFPKVSKICPWDLCWCGQVFWQLQICCYAK